MWTNEYKPDEYGFQVLLSVHNAEKYMQRCLESLDASLKGYNWILLYGDDGSTDDGVIELAKYARSITCDKVHFFEYDKALTVGMAKNRLIKESHDFKEDYPYILFMDADDEMLPERPKMIKPRFESQYVVGAFERHRIGGKKEIVKTEDNIKKLHYGPWATLFHHDFLPEDSLFFPEDEICNTGFEDILTWYHLKYIEGKVPAGHISDDPVHKYLERNGSTSKQKNVNYQRNMFWGISSLIKNNKRNIYKNPLSREEAETAMNEYLEAKNQKSNDSALHPLD
jgi:glycosyltransferase involved in cell wall biosynthesis